MQSSQAANQAAKTVDWITNIRASACLMVVALHVSAWYVLRMPEIPLSSWHVANVVDAFARSCVPLFFMISGYLFLRDRHPEPRHILRLLAALAFYSIVYRAPYWISGKVSPAEDLASMLSGPAHFHLWFFYAQFVVYLLAMVFRARLRPVASIVVPALLLLVVNPKTAMLGLPTQGIFGSAMDGSIIYYLLYASIGAGLGNAVDKGRAIIPPAVGLTAFFLSSAAITLATAWHSTEAGHYVGTYYSYAGPLVAIAAIGLFSALCRPWPTPRFLALIARLSLPIYGLHVLPLMILQALGQFNRNPIWVELPLMFGIVVAASVALSSALKRIDVRGYVT